MLKRQKKDNSSVSWEKRLWLVLYPLRSVHRKSKSVGGDPAPLKDQVKDYPIHELLETRLNGFVSKRYEVVKTDRGIHDVAESDMKPEEKNNRCLEICRQLGADTMVTVDYSYGLAAYKTEQACAAIDGTIYVYDVETKTLLMTKAISSDKYFKRGKDINTYLADNGKLYKQDLSKAVNIFLSKRLLRWRYQ